MKKTGTHAWRERFPQFNENRAITPWLRDRGSLTERLRSAGSFSVALLNQSLATPTRDEAGELALKLGQLALVREVALISRNQPVVFAHTVLARTPTGPLTRWMDRLGSRSLGSLLFAHPRFVRGPLNARRLCREHPLYAPAVKALQLTAAPPPILWARRSSFSFGRQSVLVTEVFSPRIFRFPSTL